MNIRIRLFFGVRLKLQKNHKMRQFDLLIEILPRVILFLKKIFVMRNRPDLILAFHVIPEKRLDIDPIKDLLQDIVSPLRDSE